MRNYFVAIFIFSSIACNANIIHAQTDSLPQWNEFKKMKKSDLEVRFRNDKGALKIINNKTKSNKGLLAFAGGLAVFSVVIFILGDILTLGPSALGSLFFLLLLGILFMTTSILSVTIFILYFAGKKRRKFKELERYFKNKSLGQQ
jgi:hypothetical protein